MKIKTFLLVVLFNFIFNGVIMGNEKIQLGDIAPDFTVKNHRNEDFTLSGSKGKWIILYFYPKADTPGCTSQACSFRDAATILRDEGAEIYGISTDSVKSNAKFHEKYYLNFDLLSDVKGNISKQYGVKMGIMNMSKRWTFLINPDQKITGIYPDVDPSKDASTVLAKIKEINNMNETK